MRLLGASRTAHTECEIFGVWQTLRSWLPSSTAPCPPSVFQRKLNPHVSDLLTLKAHPKVVLQEWFGPEEPRETLIIIAFFILKCRPVCLHNKCQAYKIRAQFCFTKTFCPGPTRNNQWSQLEKTNSDLNTDLDIHLENGTLHGPFGLGCNRTAKANVQKYVHSVACASRFHCFLRL